MEKGICTTSGVFYFLANNRLSELIDDFIDVYKHFNRCLSEGMAQLVKFLPHKYEDMGLIPIQHLHKNQAQKCCVCNPTNGEVNTGRIMKLSGQPF